MKHKDESDIINYKGKNKKYDEKFIQAVNNTEYYAHISKDGIRKQTVKEHCSHVAELATSFASEFGAESWGECCGYSHDIGKFSHEFQERFHGGPLVDHATAGARELLAKGGMNRFAAYCVAGHHAGLPDMGSEADDAGRATLCGRRKKKIPDYQAYKSEIVIPELKRPPVGIGKTGFSLSFFIRMVYSCLVDADFLDTEQFMQAGVSERETGTVTPELLERLNQYIVPWLACSDLNMVNGRRTAILKNCLLMGEQKPGVYTLTVPTGGGKTVSSLAFALKHACSYQKKRIIYVIPYTSIIEQNADVFRKILGGKHVLEHHSGVEYGEGEELKPMQLAAENWDKPVVVTTNVQFFESLFSNRSSKCRKLHNIANSVLIFDEAQMIPAAYLKPCMAAIEELTENYGCTAVLCTATQPGLQKFFQHPEQTVELCPNVEEQFRFFKRTTVQNLGMLSEDELISRLKGEWQALCILNRRKYAQKLYEELKEALKEDGVYHLSTLMYPAHRKRILKQIRQRLEAGEPCIVVATSLVEAGVDLDFEHVYRELAGIDSVVQAAGRCNREGQRALADSDTFVFQLEDQSGIPAELKLPMKLARIVAEQYENLASLEAIDSYFGQLHKLKGEQLDQKRIVEAFEAHARQGSYPFASVASQFHLIEQKSKLIVVSIEDEAKKLADRVRRGECSRDVMRKISQYSVHVYENDYEKIRAAGYLDVPAGWENEVAILRDEQLYQEDSGLKSDVSYGMGIFCE